MGENHGLLICALQLLYLYPIYMCQLNLIEIDITFPSEGVHLCVALIAFISLMCEMAPQNQLNNVIMLSSKTF